MTAVFADTFYWIALTNPKDEGHERAKTYKSAGEIFTTEEVLTEYLNFFCSKGATLRGKAAQVAAALAAAGSAMKIIPQSHSSYASGLALYQRRFDKEYSLTDWISMEAMRERGLTGVLTNDHHFEQEGFVALLRNEPA